MDAVMPWRKLFGLVAPHYPKGEKGHKPIRLEIVSWVYFLQQWFALNDPGVTEKRSLTCRTPLRDLLQLTPISHVDILG